jgi:hypothetical protein
MLTIIAILITLFTPAASPVSAGTPPRIPESIILTDSEIEAMAGYRFKAGIHSAGEPASLTSKASIIERIIEELPDNSGALFTLLDSHAVFALPPGPIIECLSDNDGESDIYPRMVLSKDLTPEKGPGEPHIQEVRTEFSFIGIGDSFQYRIEKLPLHLSDGAFIIVWRLTESLDGKFRELYGSWYAAPLTPAADGSPRTYLRNFVTTIFTDPIPGTSVTMKLFGTADLRGFYDALRKAAASKD